MAAEQKSWLTRITERIIHRVPELGLEKNVHLREGFIDTAFTQIIVHANANKYELRWDKDLVECVVRLYNYQGLEGSTERTADGVSDSYDGPDILSPYLSRNVQQYIRPVGYQYSSTRFEYPL